MINTLMLTVVILKSIYTLNSFIASKRKSSIFVAIKKIVCPILSFIIINGLVLLLIDKVVYKNAQLLYFSFLTLILLIDFLRFKTNNYE